MFIDYSFNQPGLDNGATEYVHIPDNPYWGDLWVKNKRSKDDLGHMMRAIAHVARYAASFDDPALKEDAEQIRQSRHLSCTRRVHARWDVPL